MGLRPEYVPPARSIRAQDYLLSGGGRIRDCSPSFEIALRAVHVWLSEPVY